MLIIINSRGPAQNPCVGPLNLTVVGSETGQPMTIQYDSYDIFCNGMDEGAIELNVTGGNPEYVCIWNTGEEGEGLYNLEEGMYTVTITDEFDCMDSLLVEIVDVDPWRDELELIEDNGCGSCTLTDGQDNYFYSDDEYMIYVEDVEDGIDLGELQICTYIHPLTIYENENPLLNRSWCINSQGGKARFRFYFTGEEREIFMNESETTTLDPDNLFIRSYNGNDGTLDSYESIRIIENIQLYSADPEMQVWFIEFELDGLLPGNSCFYLEHVKEDTDINTTEVKSVVENVARFTINNPVMDELTLTVEGINTLVDVNFKIEDVSQKLVMSESYDKKRLSEEKFSVSSLDAAMYFLTIEFPDLGTSKTLKFVKVR